MSSRVELWVYVDAERASRARFIMLSMMTRTESLCEHQEPVELLAQSHDLIIPAPGSKRAARFRDMFRRTGR